MKQHFSFSLMAIFIMISMMIVITIASTRLPNNAETQLKITFIATSLGTLIALLSAALLLFRAAAGAGFTELLPLILPLLAGTLVASFHWSIVQALGMLGVSLFVRDIMGTPGERRGKGGATGTNAERDR